MTTDPRPEPTPPPRRLSVADDVIDVDPAEDAADPENAQPPSPSPTLPASEGDQVPDWVVLPADLKAPRGRQVVFIRLRAELTAMPHKGERQCIVWTMSDAEEKAANDRTNGKAERAPSEMTKGMIRAVDGRRVDWGKASGPGSLDEFWSEIGPKGRNLLFRVFTQLHLASEGDQKDFFENCVAVRTVV